MQWLLGVLPAVLLLGVGIAVGVVIGRSTKGSEKASFSALPVSAIGDLASERWSGPQDAAAIVTASPGREERTLRRSTPCGAALGKDVAHMSGSVWIHVPNMVEHFREEKIPFANFSGNEMANLIAYLHSGASPAP